MGGATNENGNAVGTEPTGFREGMEPVFAAATGPFTWDLSQIVSLYTLKKKLK